MLRCSATKTMQLIGSPLLRYGAAAVTSAVAFLLALALYEVFEPIPSVPFFAAVAISAWYGGLGPGLLATALGALAGSYLFFGSPFSLRIEALIDAVRIGSIVLVGLLISLLSAGLRAARRRAEAATAEAEAAVRTRDEFISTVSHDLKTPLTTIKGMAQLLEHRARRLGAEDAEPLAELARRIDATSNKMRSQIDELLDATLLQLGQPLELQPGVIDLVEIAREVVEAHQRTTQAHTIRLETTETELVGVVDAGRIERVLNNLLANAIKYSPNGGDITVRLTRREEGGRPWAVLSVEDHGVGIPSEDQAHIFERYHRAENVVGRIQGTGLGLASACQIVTQHGGSIVVDSEVGKGSTFTVRLPLGPVAHREPDGSSLAPRAERKPA